ncbi:MAG: hypothetical protein ACO1PM_23580 [Acidovorax sp.]
MARALRKTLPCIWGVDGLLACIPDKIHSAVEQAQAFWPVATKPAQVFEQVIAMTAGPRQGPHMQVLLHIAAAVCHAFAGREEQGRKELALFISRGKAKEYAAPKPQETFEGWLKEVFNEQVG